MVRTACLVAALALPVPALTACTGGATANTSLASGNGGRYCGSYSGSKGASGSGAQDVVLGRRCFSSLAACRAWFYRVQSRAPNTFSSRRCR